MLQSKPSALLMVAQVLPRLRLWLLCLGGISLISLLRLCLLIYQLNWRLAHGHIRLAVGGEWVRCLQRA
jgi:hypothetical protein